MALFDAIGDAFGFSDNKSWSLTGEDSKFIDTVFTGQFLPENINQRGGDSNLGETTTLNKAAPNYQWLHGEGEVFSFTTRLFADTAFKSIKQELELLKSFKRRDPDLKRAPIFLFTYGTDISFTCFVRQVNFIYDELKADGQLRGAIVNISLQILDEILTEDATTNLQANIKAAAGIVAGAAGIISQVKSKINIPGGSLHTLDRTKKVKQGQTFESIAAAEYGNARLGDILRRAQPEKYDLTTGDDVILLDPVEINEITITPQSIPLKRTPENLTLLNEKLLSRSESTVILI
jgi:hypothetical protein